MTTYSNPRMSATIADWPLSSTKRGAAYFSIERDRRGERAVRATTGAPKKLTYAVKARIVDGDDGRTYIARLTAFGHVSIMKGDMKYQHEVIFDSDARYAEVCALFNTDLG